MFTFLKSLKNWQNAGILITFFSLIGNLHGQNYLYVDNNSGYPYPNAPTILENEAANLIKLLPSDLRSQFKVLSSSYYLHTYNATGNFEESIPIILANAKLKSNFYLLFVKESGDSLFFGNIKVYTELPTTGIFSCISAIERAQIQSFVQNAVQSKYAEKSNDFNFYEEAELAGIKKLESIFDKLNKCCPNNPPCKFCPDKEKAYALRSYFEGNCFVKIPVEVDTNILPAKPNVSNKLLNGEVVDLTNLRIRFSSTSEYGNIPNVMQSVLGFEYLQGGGSLKGFVTDNETFCEDNKLETIENEYKSSSLNIALWAHIWNNPEDKTDQSYLYIGSRIPVRANLCNTSDGPNIQEELDWALDLATNNGSYSTKFEQCATTVLFEAVGSCYGDKVPLTVRKEQLNNVNNLPCSGGLEEPSLFLSPANQPIQLPASSIPTFPEWTNLCDQRALFAFYTGDGRFKGCYVPQNGEFSGYYNIQFNAEHFYAKPSSSNGGKYLVYLGKKTNGEISAETKYYTPPSSRPVSNYAEGPFVGSFDGLSAAGGDVKSFIFQDKIRPVDALKFEMATEKALLSKDRSYGTLIKVLYDNKEFFFLCKYDIASNQNLWYQLDCLDAGRYTKVDENNLTIPSFYAIPSVIGGTLMLVEARKGAFKDWFDLHAHDYLNAIACIPVLGTTGLIIVTAAELANCVLYVSEGQNALAALTAVGIGVNLVCHFAGNDIYLNNKKLERDAKGWAPGLSNNITSITEAADAEIDLYRILNESRSSNILDVEIETMIAELHGLADGGKLLNAFSKQPELTKAWKVAAQHADNIRLDLDFLETLSSHLDEFPNLKLDLQDIDVFNAYKKISNDVEQAYEILDDIDGNLAILIAQKTQNSSVPNFWKWIRNGKKFEEDFLLPTLRNRSSGEYLQLKNKANQEFGVNLDQYDMYSQVQLSFNGTDYFQADQIYVKWINTNGQNVIDDIVVIENKLNSTTRLTTNQNAGKAANSLIVRSQDAKLESSVSGLPLPKNYNIQTNNKWIKIYDSENGDVISGINKL